MTHQNIRRFFIIGWTSVAIHQNLANGSLPKLVFGKNEPALIRYHQNIAEAIGSDKLISIG